MTAALDPTRGVDITFLLDRSGSMQSIRADVIGGYNAFLAEQQAQPGECRLTLATFDTQGFDYLCMGVEIADVKPMTDADFVPRAGTPLYDAIARALTDAEARVGGQKHPPVQLFVVMTDGEENSSTTHDRQQIFERIETKQAQGWTFAYLGANQDAYGEASKISVPVGSTADYAATPAGVAGAFASTSSAVSAVRTSTSKGVTPDPGQFYGKKGDSGNSTTS